MQVSGGIQWVMVVNLIIWTGLFLYLRRLDGKLRELESLPLESAAPTAAFAAAATFAAAASSSSATSPTPSRTATGEETIR
ncbi:MAG TPA: CcmD family protein [Thermoanaerobaculia bacterium]|nr:CcmD family protein [Thermoanaerobaculia bacterium]